MMSDSADSGLDEKEVTVVKNATDLQRLKLEKLMKNPEKLAFIPDRPKDKKFSDPAEFVRNVMGSSAGAGSGEFHVYRHIRRREYARQDFLQDWKEKEELNIAYHEKIEANKKEVENRAAKKRCKRHRRKERQRAKRQKLKEMKKKGIPIPKSSSSSEESSEEEESKEDNDVKEETKSKPESGCEIKPREAEDPIQVSESDKMSESDKTGESKTELGKRCEESDKKQELDKQANKCNQDDIELVEVNNKSGNADEKEPKENDRTEEIDKIKDKE